MSPYQWQILLSPYEVWHWGRQKAQQGHSTCSHTEGPTQTQSAGEQVAGQCQDGSCAAQDYFLNSLCVYIYNTRGAKKEDEPTASGESTWSHCFLTQSRLLCVGEAPTWFVGKIPALSCVLLFVLIMGFVWGDTAGFCYKWVTRCPCNFPTWKLWGQEERGMWRNLWSLDLEGWLWQVFLHLPGLLRTCCEFVRFCKEEKNIHTREIRRVSGVNPRPRIVSIHQGSSSCGEPWLDSQELATCKELGLGATWPAF